jgi:hypothetical protein
MSSPEDSRLRTQFANLREEDGSVVPPFERIANAKPASPRRRYSVQIAVAAIPVLAVVVMFSLRSHRSTDPVSRDITAWSSPTAFLLETPGKQILTQTPKLGAPPIK